MIDPEKPEHLLDQAIEAELATGRHEDSVDAAKRSLVVWR